MARRMMGALVTAMILSACGSSTPAMTTPATAPPYSADGAVPPMGMQPGQPGLASMPGYAELWGWPEHEPPVDRVAIADPFALPTWAISPWWGGVGQGGLQTAAMMNGPHLPGNPGVRAPEPGPTAL
ncbi:MAG: hypothetical protein H7338_20765 [Candidatus Sericytochromatia bacterium]|nr:hypothetical protein [Candidatus Sericytochromatia bacterium]